MTKYNDPAITYSNASVTYSQGDSIVGSGGDGGHGSVNDLSFVGVAYTYLTGTGSGHDSVNLPASAIGDLMVLMVNGNLGVFSASGAAITAAGWGTEFNGTAGSSNSTLISIYRICDGTESTTNNTLFNDLGIGVRLYVCLVFRPTVALPPINQILNSGISGYWPNGVATGASPGSPFAPGSNVLTMTNGPALQSNSPPATGFALGVNFLHCPGATAVWNGLVSNPLSTFPVGIWAAGSILRPDLSSSWVWENSGDGNPSDEFATDLWHASVGSWYVSVDFSLTYLGAAPPPDPTPFASASTSVKVKWDPQTWW